MRKLNFSTIYHLNQILFLKEIQNSKFIKKKNRQFRKNKSHPQCCPYRDQTQLGVEEQIIVIIQMYYYIVLNKGPNVSICL